MGNMRNIYFNKKIKRYLVYKDIDGKSHHFGSFEDYDEAVNHKLYCEEHGWDLRCKLNSMKGNSSPRYRVAHMYGLPVKQIPR